MRLSGNYKGYLANHKQSNHEGKKYPFDSGDYQTTTRGHLTNHKQSQHEGKLKACLSTSQASEGLIFRRRCRTAGAHGKRAAAARF